MAERVTPVPTPVPVAEVVAAWNERSAERFAIAFAGDAHLAVPPMHLEFDGRDDIAAAAAGLFAAFGALRYTLRHRYLSPGGVTDEAVLEGLQTREFLGAPPTGTPGAVAVRVLIEHDGRQIRSLALWPDVAALREMSDGVARRIDLRTAGPAAPVVAALRATIPAPEGKFSVGQGRQLVGIDEIATLLPAGGAGAAALAGEHGKGRNGTRDGAKDGAKDAKKDSKKDGPKAPLPRKVRRFRAVVAGLAMLAVAGVLVTYVVQGVKKTKDPVVAAGAAQAAVAPTPPAAPSPSPRAAPAPQQSAPAAADEKVTFDRSRNTYRFPNAVLFETNRYSLRPEARNALLQVIKGLKGDRRYGTVEVFGYTDSVGAPALNLALSRRRANAVAAFLRGSLDPAVFTVVPVGRGANDFIAANDTAQGRQKNRRVEIKVPQKDSASPAPSPPCSPLPR